MDGCFNKCLIKSESEENSSAFRNTKAVKSHLKSRSPAPEQHSWCVSGLHSPTHRQQTLLDGVSLSFGQAATFGQTIHRMEEGVNKGGKGLGASKQRSTLG